MYLYHPPTTQVTVYVPVSPDSYSSKFMHVDVRVRKDVLRSTVMMREGNEVTMTLTFEQQN